MKHLKQYQTYSQLNENRTTADFIDAYKKSPQMWDMAKAQYEYIIGGDQMTMDELKPYYPNWEIADFKEVYLALEGELPEDAI